MITILELASRRRDKPSVPASLVEQQRRIEQTTKQSVGLASRAFQRALKEELAKLKVVEAK